MGKSLYDLMREAEGINERLRNDIHEFIVSTEDFSEIQEYARVRFGEIPSKYKCDPKKVQSEIMEDYDKNSVFEDAMYKRKTVTESLEELGQINKGIRRFLPRRKKKTHNERLEQLGELIGEPEQLRARGILSADNIVTGGTYTALTTFGIYFLFENVIAPETVGQLDFYFPAAVAAIAAPLAGFGFNLGRLVSLPTSRTEYLDAKIKEKWHNY